MVLHQIGDANKVSVMNEKKQNHEALLKGIATLEEKILKLLEENTRLKSSVHFLRLNPKLVDGIKGETLVANLIGGKLTPHTAPHDLALGRKGRRDLKIEVKYSNLGQPDKNVPTKRWSWAGIFGLYHGKDFDRILLIGAADPRYKRFYRDVRSPFVIFDLSYKDAKRIARGSDGNIIQLTTNPLSVTSAHLKELFHQHQCTTAELKKRYKFKKFPKGTREEE
jgi:hypothetical protein